MKTCNLSRLFVLIKLNRLTDKVYCYHYISREISLQIQQRQTNKLGVEKLIPSRLAP